MKTIKLSINNNVTKLEGYQPSIDSLDKATAIRNPNAFFLRKYMKPGWDGKIHYINSSGLISTGLLPDLEVIANKQGIKLEIERVSFGPDEESLKVSIPSSIGEYKLRPYQLEAVEAITKRRFLGELYPRGILKAATNAGKNIIIAFLYKTYNQPTILIFKDKELFDTALKEIGPMIPPEELGIVKSGKIRWGKLTIVMAPTLVRNIQTHKKELAKFRVCIVDECDLSDNATYKKIITLLHNTYVRVGLSGTFGVMPLAKHKPRDNNIKAFFSNMIYEIRNKELIEMGYSSNLVIRFLPGAKDLPSNLTYPEEVTQGIINNSARNQMILDRVKLHVKRGRTPILITSKLHEHISILFKRIKKLYPNLRVSMVHHKSSKRQDIISAFERGEIDILVASFIVKRGKNFPHMRAMINAGGGDDFAIVLQLLGRAARKHSSKKETFFEDFYDDGQYLKRHSKHRVQALERDGLTVIKQF